MPSAYSLAMYRLSRKRWGLNTRTRNRLVIGIEDKLLVYVAGVRQNRQCFIASATAASKAIPALNEERTAVNAPKEYRIFPSDFLINLKDIRFFKVPVSIKSIRKRLTFITSPDSIRWGCRLVGGTLRISDKDYNFILRTASQLKVLKKETKISG